jgi:hypothetical protein
MAYYQEAAVGALVWENRGAIIDFAKNNIGAVITSLVTISGIVITLGSKVVGGLARLATRRKQAPVQAAAAPSKTPASRRDVSADPPKTPASRARTSSGDNEAAFIAAFQQTEASRRQTRSKTRT